MPDDAVSTPLHLLGHFVDAFTGGERELPDLADALRGRRECVVWSDVAPHPAYAERGVRQVGPDDFPTGGMLLLGGVHVGVGEWLKGAQFERVAMRYNLPQHERLFRMTAHLRASTGLEPEILFASAALQLSTGLQGVFEPSLIPLAPFLAVPLARPPEKPFTVGRASRDVLEKHNPDDVMLYRVLAARGVQVRIMGGTCLAPWLAGAPNVELLPTGTMPVADFNASLDVFLYRTGTFFEPYGRVVFEAMGSGLPVVVTTHGGFADQIREGKNGMLFDTQEQAYDAVMKLRDDAVLRLAIAAEARKTAASLHGSEAVEKLLRFYLR